LGTNRIIQILNDEAEDIIIDDYDYNEMKTLGYDVGEKHYSIISTDQMKELVRIANPMLEKFQIVFKENSQAIIKIEWQETVEKAFVYGEHVGSNNEYHIGEVYELIKGGYKFLEMSPVLHSSSTFAAPKIFIIKRVVSNSSSNIQDNH
jgi:hypothetical protein